MATIQSCKLSFCISVERSVGNVKTSRYRYFRLQIAIYRIDLHKQLRGSRCQSDVSKFRAVLCEVGKLLKRANIVMLRIANNDRLDLHAQRYDCHAF
jgi:hypothetical protein